MTAAEPDDDVCPRCGYGDYEQHCRLCCHTTLSIVNHVRLMHPDQGPDRWPDGQLVVVDATLEPEDFRP